MTAAIRIGTSGWAYDHWKGPFYPARIGSDAILATYAQQFDAVELNSTFYRLPAPETLERWANTVPSDFRFAVKASRYITHIKKLKDPHETLPPFLERVGLLGRRLGPVLLQLPPRFRYNGERLRAVLDALPDDIDCAFEFRDESWFNDEALRLLHARGAALCLYDLAGRGGPARGHRRLRVRAPARPERGLCRALLRRRSRPLGLGALRLGVGRTSLLVFFRQRCGRARARRRPTPEAPSRIALNGAPRHPISQRADRRQPALPPP